MARNWKFTTLYSTWSDVPRVDLINFRVEYVRLRSGRCLGREAAERATKSREVDLSRLKGLINKTKDFSESLTGSTQLIEGAITVTIAYVVVQKYKYNKWNINTADYVSGDKDGSQKQWPIFSRRPCFLLYPFKPFTCCYNAHQACIITLYSATESTTASGQRLTRKMHFITRSSVRLPRCSQTRHKISTVSTEGSA